MMILKKNKGRPKKHVTEEERIQQHERRKEKRRVKNLSVEKAEQKRQRKRVENLPLEVVEQKRKRERVENRLPEVVEKKRERERVENLPLEVVEQKRQRERVESLTQEQVVRKRERKRLENLTVESAEKTRKRNIKAATKLKAKKQTLFLGDITSGAYLIVKPLSIGFLSDECRFCRALSFPNEPGRAKHNCCHGGKVVLPPLSEYPAEMKSLLDGSHPLSQHFRSNIRVYNNAFAFASFSANVVSLAARRSPYVLKIQGPVQYKATTSLQTTKGESQYGQLYIYDFQESVERRMKPERNKEVIEIINRYMTTHNPYAAHFYMLYEQSKDNPDSVLQFVKFKQDDQRRYNAPVTGDVAAVITGKGGDIKGDVDVYVYPKDEKEMAFLPESSAHKDPMSFPVMFPDGDLGWTYTLQKADDKKITPLQYYSYRLAVRPGKFSPCLYAGRLTQQYEIHAYLQMELQRMNFMRFNQSQLRIDTYKGIMDQVANSAANHAGKLGSAIILPATYEGSPRNMQQHYLDALAIMRKYGLPDLFITMTCNPNWPEIKHYIKSCPPQTSSADVAAVVCRSFFIRKQKLIEMITNGSVFGEISAQVHTVEFQKRGLPHVHLIVSLRPNNKLNSPEKIDKFICAEIPDKETDSMLHYLVLKHMLHGPHVGSYPCKKENSYLCIRKFPRKIIDTTQFNPNGKPEYRRRDNSDKGYSYLAKVDKSLYPVNNQWVVPYNPYLLKKMNCHINVECCASVMALKYINKYIHKGHDRARLEVTEINDEISHFVDARYLSAMEASWRRLELPLHGRSHSVTRLSIHLPAQQYATFTENDGNQLLRDDKRWATTLTQWFLLNQQTNRASHLLYSQICDYYLWDYATKTWKERKNKRQRVISRMVGVSPKDSERFHLKLLLTRIPGSTSYEYLRTKDGVVYQTFKEAAVAHDLTANDDYVFEIFDEAAETMMPKQLRYFFVNYLIANMEPVGDKIFNKYQVKMSDDFSTNKTYHALKAITRLLKKEGFDGDTFGLTTPNFDDTDILEEALTPEEIRYHEDKANELSAKMNIGQRTIFDAMTTAIDQKQTGSYFIDGPGGTGKTFIYCALHHLCKAKRVNVKSVAWTGIAATLLNDGQTAHKMFNLPFLGPRQEEDEVSIIVSKTKKQEFLNLDVVIWDEASMIPRWAVEAIDRTLRDVRNNDTLFGGVLFLFGGDFRQVLPIVKHGEEKQIVEQCLKYSDVWPETVKFRLTQNMRASGEDFAKWLLTIGNGEVKQCIQEETLWTDDVISAVFPPELAPREYITRAILSPHNESVNTLNEGILRLLSGETVAYYASDMATYPNVDDIDIRTNEDCTIKFPPEYLQTQTPSGLPPYQLNVKKGAIIMLLRNMSLSQGLCNGTRLKVIHCTKRILCAEILQGPYAGQVTNIPRIKLTSEAHGLPYVLHRTQFPVRLAFAMTINKSQGQTFDTVGIYVDEPIFSHGQLYVAFSRCRTKENIYIQSKKGIENIVFKSVITE